LSGGEKARLVLAMLVWQRPNLLLLDEPTNHLDLTTREALSIALNEFEGTVMLVSHDRALLREVCDEFWLVAGGAVKPFDGDLDDYQRWLLEQSRAAARERSSAAAVSRQRREATAPSKALPASSGRNARPSGAGTDAGASERAASNSRGDRQSAAKARQQLEGTIRPLRKELNLVDNRLGVLFTEREALEAAFAAGALAPSDLADSGKRLKAIGEQIDALEARWLELSTQIDQLAEASG